MAPFFQSNWCYAFYYATIFYCRKRCRASPPPCPSSLLPVVVVTHGERKLQRRNHQLRNGDGHGNGYNHDCCGSTATWWLRPRLLQLNGGLAATSTATAKTTTAAA